VKTSEKHLSTAQIAPFGRS